MEFVLSWRNGFVAARYRHDADAITRYLRDAPDCLRCLLPDAHIENALEVIYDKNKGLFKFMEDVLSERDSQWNASEYTLVEAFNMIKFVMEFSKQDYELYITQTKDICLHCINTPCSFIVKKEASETLKKLIKLFKDKVINLYEIVVKYEEEGVLYIVLGAIAKYCPETKNLAETADAIFLQLLYNLQNKIETYEIKQSIDEIEICLECFLDMLVNFVPFRENPESDYFYKLYNLLLILCEKNVPDEVVNKSISIISTHMQHFSSFVFRDYEKWHNLLNQLYKKSQSICAVDALKAVYEIIPLHLIEEAREDIFLYFKNYFMTNMSNPMLSSAKSGLIIYGLGQFSQALAKYSPMQMIELFQILTYRATKFTPKKESADEEIETIPQYLQALSEIMHHMTSVSLHHLNVIIELSVLIIKRFPELNEKNQFSAINVLRHTFIRIKQLEKNFQQRYFHYLFYEGVLWTCSHALNIDLQFLKEARKRSIDYVCYKNYVNLWQSLFKAEGYQEEFAEKLFHELTMVVISFMENLNLNFRSLPNKNYADSSLILKAESETDFRYYINLVDLCCDLYATIDIDVLLSEAEKLLLYFIKSSYKYHLVSGYYKLIRVIFQRFGDNHTFSKHTCELVPQYLLDVLKLVNELYDELQLSCIHLIFSAPLLFVSKIVEDTVAIFKVAFKIGLKDLSLAFCALETLEHWSNRLDNPSLRQFRKEAVFHLDPYLTSEENWLESNSEKLQLKTNSTLALSSDTQLEALQKRILMFYSTLDHQTLSDFVYIRQNETKSQWFKKEQLQYELLFSDAHLEFNYDCFIARVIELTKTIERRIKFSACELLHTLITIILGKRLVEQCFQKELCSHMLKLGSDADDAVRNLFHPLVIELTHYLSMKPMVESSRVTKDFLDVMFDGLTDEFDVSHRDYCGICLKEFVQWTIKQSTETDTSKHTNFTIFIKRIMDFATYPCNGKRLAAAIAFNHLYITLGGSISVINIYWLQFLWAFVNCLEQCGDLRISSAITNIEAVIKVTANPLNAKCRRRVKPPEFASENLRSAVVWLLEKCGSLNIQCRLRCMDLFENLCVLVPGFKSIRNFISVYGVNYINSVALKYMEENFQVITILKVKAFLRCLDFYMWLFSKKILSPELALDVNESGGGGGRFFGFFARFVSTVIEKSIEETAREVTSTDKDADELIDLMNKAVIKLFKFTMVVLMNRQDDSKVLDHLWIDNYFTLIFRFTLGPRKLGLTSKTIQTIEPQLLENWFLNMMKNLPEPHLTRMYEHRFLDNQEECITFAIIENHCKMQGKTFCKSKGEIMVLKDFVRGMIILRNCELFDFGVGNEFTIPYLLMRITAIYESSKVFLANDDANKKVDSYVKDYVKDVLKLFLLKYHSELVEAILKILISDAITNGSSTSHQERFMEAFRGPIFQCMLRNPCDSLLIMIKLLHPMPNYLLSLLSDLLTFARYFSSNELAENLANEVLRRCDNLCTLTSEVQSFKDRLFDIFRMAIELKSKPSDVLYTGGIPSSFYYWVIEQLKEAQDLDRRIVVIDNFITCMVDASDIPNADLGLVFGQLRNPVTTEWSLTLQTQPTERHKAIRCLKMLLKKFLLTRSVILFEGVVRFAAGACSLLLNKHTMSERISPCFSGYADSAWNALETVYRIFKDRLLQAEDRVDVLNYFLIPALEASPIVKAGCFYKKYNQEINALANEFLPETNVNERKHAIASRIGGFRLFELIFGRLQHGNGTRYNFEYIILLQDNVFNYATGVRSLSARFVEEKELMRQMHCAALNCAISFTNYKSCIKENYDWIFNEVRARDQLIWERIIDCDKVYDMQIDPATSSKRFVNILDKVTLSQALLDSSFAAFFRRYDPTTAHFNAVNEDEERRKWIILEEDELNDHECTVSITATIMHFFNESIVRLPMPGIEISDSELPKWMLHFREAFHIGKNNITLFLLRIISNVKKAFLPYLRCFFEAIANAVLSYLGVNRLNYLVRDVLMMLADVEYEIRNEVEKDLAQELVEILIERAVDSREEVYDYNIEIIEGLIGAWSRELKLPKNFKNIVDNHPDLAMRIVLLLLRHRVDYQELLEIRELHSMVRVSMFKWHEPDCSIRTFEVIGWILRFVSRNERDMLIANDLVDLFSNIQRQNSNLCVQYMYRLYLGYPSISKRPEFIKFYDPVNCSDDDRKHECFEIFYETMSNLDPSSIYALLERMNLKGLLRDRAMPCVEIGFRIIEKLVGVFDVNALLSYAETIETYTGRNALLEHKNSAYVIFMSIYEKYCKEDLNCFEEAKSLMSLCKKVLINGVSDPSDEIQEEVLAFWKDRASLSPLLITRLCQLLELYSNDVHSSFAQFVCVLILDLTASSNDNQKIQFSSLVQSAWYEEYELIVTTSQRKEAPLFVSSLAGLAERVVAQQGSRIRRNKDSRLLEPDSTVVGADLLEKLTRPNMGQQPKTIPDPSENKLSKRHPTNESSLPIDLKEDYYQKILREFNEQHAMVKVNRRYRIMSYPDVEITQSAVVATLEDTALKDRSFAENMLVSLICSLLRSEDLILVDTVEKMCKKVLEQKNDFVPAALEIICRTPFLGYPAHDLTSVAIAMDLQPLGIILLEREPISREYNSYAVQCQDKPLEENAAFQHRHYLARLYRSISEMDMCSSIVNNWFMDNVDPVFWKDGCLAEIHMQWEQATAAYEQALEIGCGLAQDFCQEGLLKCLTMLSSWETINIKFEAALQNDSNSIIDNIDKYKLIPWILQGRLQKTIEEVTNRLVPDSNFLNLLEKWLDYYPLLPNFFGEEIASINLSHSITAVRRYLCNHLNNLKSNWIHNGELSILKKIQDIRDVDAYLEVKRSMDSTIAANTLTEYWKKNPPEDGEDLAWWNARVNKRIGLAYLLFGSPVDYSLDSEEHLKIIVASIQQRLKISSFAICHCNRAIALKQNIEIEKALSPNFHHVEYVNLCHSHEQIDSSLKFMCGELESNLENRFLYYSSSWKQAHKLLNNESVPISIKIKANQDSFKIMNRLYNLVQTNSEYKRFIVEDEFTSILLKTKEPEAVHNELLKCCIDTLKSLCKEGSEQDMAYGNEQFVDYCFEFINCSSKEFFNLSEDFIAAVLNSMRFGSKKALRYFPYLLKDSLYANNQKAVDVFENESSKIPCWMFLKWKELIIFKLSSTLAFLVKPIIHRMICDYPDAVIYDIHALVKSNSRIQRDEEILTNFYKPLLENGINKFLDIIEHAYEPERYLYRQLYEIMHSQFSHDDLKLEINTVITKIFANSDTGETQNSSFKKLLSKYHSDLEKLRTSNSQELTFDLIKQICNSLEKAMRSRAEGYEFETSKPDFLSFESLDLEIPGQYLDIDKPPPRKHRAKVAGMRNNYESQCTKRTSEVIKLLGSDGKTYCFRVKFGMDSLIEQRCQKIFQSINDTLMQDKICLNRKLRLKIHNIVPLSSYFGLVEEIDKTKNLEDFVQFCLKDRSAFQEAIRKYWYWIEHAGRGGQNEIPCKSVCYKQAAVKYRAKDVKQLLLDCSRNIESDLLRKTFVQISDSVMSFVKLRKNFILSYATACITHWLVGIGHRKPTNILIQIKSGHCYSINNSLIFGMGFDQPVPELVPFRLTPQIIGMLKPFKEQDLLGTIMSHVVTALRNDKNLILTCFDAVLHEDLDWTARVNKEWKEEGLAIDVKWSPKKKYKIAQQKLNGAKPSEIMLEELKHIHGCNEVDRSQFFLYYTHIVNGTELEHPTVRSIVKTDNLSPQEQVHCLLDQAKDYNTLGRMWVEWYPFV